MAGQPSPIREALAPVLRDLDRTGIERAKAVAAVQRLIALAQSELVSNGGYGTGEETLALLVAAGQLVMGYVRNHESVTWEQLTASLERADGPALRMVKP